MSFQYKDLLERVIESPGWTVPSFGNKTVFMAHPELSKHKLAVRIETLSRHCTPREKVQEMSYQIDCLATIYDIINLKDIEPLMKWFPWEEDEKAIISIVELCDKIMKNAGKFEEHPTEKGLMPKDQLLRVLDCFIKLREMGYVYDQPNWWNWAVDDHNNVKFIDYNSIVEPGTMYFVPEKARSWWVAFIDAYIRRAIDTGSTTKQAENLWSGLLTELYYHDLTVADTTFLPTIKDIINGIGWEGDRIETKDLSKLPIEQLYNVSQPSARFLYNPEPDELLVSSHPIRKRMRRVREFFPEKTNTILICDVQDGLAPLYFRNEYNTIVVDDSDKTRRLRKYLEEHNRHLDKVKFIDKDISKINQPDESVDVIIAGTDLLRVACSKRFETVGDIESAIKLFFKMLKPGGRLFADWPRYLDERGLYCSRQVFLQACDKLSDGLTQEITNACAITTYMLTKPKAKSDT